MSARAQRKQPAEYDSALVPAIADVRVHLDSGTVALVDKATIAVTRFDATHAATLLPFTPLLLRGESVASSRIEQLTSSARKVLEAELLGTSQGNAALIVAATAQMSEAITTSEIPDEETVLHMHRLLMEGSQPTIAGRYREEPVWIGGSDTHPVGSLYTAPHPRLLPELMTDLVDWLRRDDIPVLAHAAIAHAQFETIHPFVDGNGRTGRALIHTLLRARGLTVNGALPLSAGILEEPDTYFTALDAYRNGDIDTIVRLVAHAALRATELGAWLGTELAEVRESWNARVHARSDAVDWRILDILVRQPLVDVVGLSAELNIAGSNIRKGLERLEADGVLLSAQVEKTRRAWRAPEVLELLDEFAERAGRRGKPTPGQR
ncbi:filamentation induced by cAMP protein fic [Corynebacterium halotolerans YIM 70093 = DSM 44683]|uniref:Filamentation induced by cAMP protein fic n=2 Tax=Corynebacterium halotolerans TaxID=225326 RepID=M1NNW4_9CORY|nr:filamentation induced by cAMP protein fic [Corynebacterium halotolerans YIM 70093 = DSM 44683]